MNIIILNEKADILNIFFADESSGTIPVKVCEVSISSVSIHYVSLLVDADTSYHEEDKIEKRYASVKKSVEISTLAAVNTLSDYITDNKGSHFDKIVIGMKHLYYNFFKDIQIVIFVLLIFPFHQGRVYV